MTRHGDPPVVVPARAPAAGFRSRGGVRRHRERHLRDYAECPARHRHGVVDGLGDVAPRPAHERMHRAVSVAIERLERAAGSDGSMPGPDAAAAALDASWAAHGPVGDRWEGLHRGIARRAVANAALAIAGEAGALHHRETWDVDVGPGVVMVHPDRIVERPWGGVVVQSLVFGPPGGPSSVDALHALLWLGARQRFPDHAIAVEVFDAEAGETHAIDVLDPEDAVTPYADAIAGIAGLRFEARPGPGCAACPYLLVCGA